MGAEEPRKTNVTEEVRKIVMKNAETVFQWCKRDRKLLDDVIRESSNSKEKHTFMLLESIVQDVQMSVATGTQNTLLLLSLITSGIPDSDTAKLIKQMEKDIVRIEEEHGPVINAIKQAIEMRDKVMRDNK